MIIYELPEYLKIILLNILFDIVGLILLKIWYLFAYPELILAILGSW